MQLAVVETLTALPGQCKICGGAGKPWYLDTGTQEEYYGAVVYCSDCIGAIAELCGFMTPESKAKLEAELSSLEAMNYELKVKLDGYREIQSGLNILANSGNTPASGSSPSRAILEDSVTATQRVPESGATVGTGTGEDAESSDDKDLAGLHSGPEQSEDFRFNL